MHQSWHRHQIYKTGMSLAKASAKSDEEMLDACKEFESYLWEQVLKSMKSASEVFNTEGRRYRW